MPRSSWQFQRKSLGRRRRKTVDFDSSWRNPRPKRRHDHDNPYTIYTIGKEEHIRYYVAFRDGQGVHHHVEVTEAVFKAFDEFELEDLSRLNELDNHLDKSGVDVDTVCPRLEDSTEARAIERIHTEQLFDGLDALTKTQRRRLKLHIIDGLTYSQIATKEGCSIAAVSLTIATAVNSLKTMTTRP